MARRLPIAPNALPSKRRLPLLDDVRDVDKQRPRYCVWEITLKCDLACRHCGSRAGRARPDELDTAEALDLADQLVQLGIREVTLIGGEAYLRDDWTEIAGRLTSQGVTVSMTTGGRGVTPEHARAAKAAGMSTVSVSIDGLEETHDSLRGVKGSWRAARDALDNLRTVGVPVSVNTQICNPTRKQLEPMLPMLLEHKIHSWQIQLTVAMGRAADEHDILLQPFQMIEVMPMAARVKRLTLEHGVRLWPGSNTGYFGPYEGLLRNDVGGYGDGCPAGRGSMGIEANGDIKGCPSLPTADYVGGNIRDQRLVEIWERSEPMRFTRVNRKGEMWGFCGDCYYADVCQGGCSWTAHVLFGKRGNNPFCHHRSLELLDKGRRERLVPAKAAPNLPFDHGEFALIEEDWPQDLVQHAHSIAKTGEGWLDER